MRQLIAILFIAVVSLVPTVWLDLFPFSAFPMFSDNTDRARVTEVFDLQGRRLNSVTYGLFDFQIANRGQRYGTVPSPSFYGTFDELNAENLRLFLERFYSAQSFPILVTSFERRYSEFERRVIIPSAARRFLVERKSENELTVVEIQNTDRVDWAVSSEEDSDGSGADLRRGDDRNASEQR